MFDSVFGSPKVAWFFICLCLYWAFCIFWGAKSARKTDTAADLFIAGRTLPVWAYVMGVTGASFAGWNFIGQPGLYLRDGLQVGYASFAAIMVPLTGVVFFKRQWMLGKRFGFVTPGEMYADYFRSDFVRVVSAVIAILFAVPFLAMLLGASGFLVAIATDGWLSRETAMWSLAAVMLIYVTAGGLRAVAYVGTLQTLLLAVGPIVLGLGVLNLVGGFEALNQGLAKVAATTLGPWGTTQGHGGGDFNALFAAPGVVQWTEGLGQETPTGGLWTGVMVLSFLMALLGVQASPAFSLWAFASRTPKPFAPQQVWASACVVGLLLFFFVTCQGIGSLLLGASGPVNDAGLALARVLPVLEGDRLGRLVPELVNLIGGAAPWLAGILIVCLLAAIKAAGGAYMTGAGAIIARDIYKRFFNVAADDRQQKLCGRITILVTTVLALLMATFLPQGMVILGTLAISLSLQLWPALAAVTWIPWFTRQGVTGGLIVGVIVTVGAEAIGQRLTDGALAWGQWPWTIHGAVWGLAANFAVCVLGSAMAGSDDETAHRARFHGFLRDHAQISARKRRYAPAAWVLVLAWMFFAIGPGIVLGNHLFGAPNAGYEGWDFAMPSIWAWQLLWWGLGVLLIWFLAYKMEMSTEPHKDVIALTEDVTRALGGSAASGQRGGPQDKNNQVVGYGFARK